LTLLKKKSSIKIGGVMMREKISLKNLISSLIEAIDMYNHLLKDHHRRTAIIAYHLGNNYGLSKESLSRLVIAASVHDIGALHITERNQLFEEDVVNPRKHELVGMKMLDEFKPFNEIKEIIGHHHIRYDEFLSGHFIDDIREECFFLHLADRIDILMNVKHHPNESKEDIFDRIRGKFGTIFDPKLLEAFNQTVSDESFYENLNKVHMHKLVLDSLEYIEVPMEQDSTYQIAQFFSRVVDYKSSWTRKHSEFVSRTAVRIAEYMNLEEEKIHELKIAGYLHDIGKIAVPSELLEKQGALSKEEFTMLQDHATFSSLILSNIESLGRVARWASCHHERRDKSGYPLNLNESFFTIEVDILAFADMFVAMNENRPYRKSVSNDELLKILERESEGKLSHEVFEVIKDHFDELLELNSYVNTYVA
jgi:HD-GYP domain-containing protein (c-di-GMP phosphodiesterase class II)